MRQEHRVVLLLTLTQTLFQTGAVLLSTVGGLAGLMLAPTALLSTLPIAIVPVGTAISTIPASLLMGRIGRKRGFIVGALIGATGGAMAVAAMVLGWFWLLCVGTGLVGLYHGFAQFYRFAAAEAAAPEFKNHALSLVLTGGVVAAVAGPNLGAGAQHLIGSGLYAGSYAVVITLSLAAAAVLALTPFPASHASAHRSGPARPLAAIARQPRFLVAVGAAAVGYFVMVMVMTATPISMLCHQQSLGATALVIQWHVLGMYVPSFFTGWLIRRLGVVPLMLTGVAVLLSHVAIELSGVSFRYYVSGLTLLGVGWNFLYVGGSTLLTETHTASESPKVQAFNDFALVGVSAMAALLAGALNDAIGWQGLNLVAVPPLIAAGAGIFAYMRAKGAMRLKSVEASMATDSK